MTSFPDAATWRGWGIDPEWSRTLDVPSHDGSTHRWHLLDTGPSALEGSGDGEPQATVLCVHGNPTWAFAWKSFLTTLGDRHRVIALDQLGMGYSARVGLRRYAERVRDLGDVIDVLDLDPGSPLVVAAHDWGGAVAMGWAVDHVDRVAGMVLCNTGTAVPEGRSAPLVIRLAASRPLRDLVCRRTSIFVEGTVRLSGRKLSRADRQAFRAPYRTAGDRGAIADFVGDIPLTSPHPSEGALADVAVRLGTIDAPVLLAWGASDPVFDDDFAADLAVRLPNTSRQRFPGANHLVMAEADVAGTVDAWLTDLLTDDDRARSPRTTPLDPPPLWAGITDRSDDDSVAIVFAASGYSISFRELARRVDGVAADLRARGLRPGDHVAMLTPPGVDLVTAVYGVWRAGGVTVVADRGLGLSGLRHAVRSARPNWTIGPRAARVASTIMRWAPGAEAIDITALMSSADADVRSTPGRELPAPGLDEMAAILFTSGATGPAKGVRYTHRQLAFQRDALRSTYEVRGDDRLVAAFAPFALYGPALGVTTALPDCDVTAPGSLTMDALESACAAADATMVFASPAALANVAATSRSAAMPPTALASVRLVLSAGAPVPSETLHAIARLTPDASLHTPYGMTEALPVADIDLATIDACAGSSTTGGVCVGRPVDGAEIRVAGLDFDALDGVPAEVPAGTTGELLVRAPWVSDGYHGLWMTERHARPGDGWHRTGDVGHIDDDGRLWVEGRSVHVIHTDRGPVTSVPVERAIERPGFDGVTSGRVAAVGVGPRGVQQLVVVIEQRDVGEELAPPGLAADVRSVVSHPVAAVLVKRELPLDIRHNAKIDRTSVAAWAADVLAGGAVATKRFGWGR